MFIGQSRRSSPKPLCMVAARLRARARARALRGQIACWGNSSATRSTMARLSKVAKPSSSTSTGTRAVAEKRAAAALNCELGPKSKRSISSSKGMSK
jgi:hypothetical protein